MRALTVGFVATDEQRDIIEAPLEPLCVMACPGSGKTATSVRRLAHVRAQLGRSRGWVLLLSYSNTAVETFYKQYHQLASESPVSSDRVAIETVDSFLTKFILRPHAARVMGCNRQPFLVQGTEPFLNNFRIWDGSRLRDMRSLSIGIEDNGFKFELREKSFVTPLDSSVAEEAIRKLGRVGAYTHETGRYWALQTVLAEDRLLSALSRRFPQIIVDEAQDIGSLHEVLLSGLAEAGSSLSLIGDPHQAIYEFADADGTYLREFSKKDGARSLPLSQNRRSLECIVNVANTLAATCMTPSRKTCQAGSGAYFVKYDANDLNGAVEIFGSILAASKIDPEAAAILCRGRSYISALHGASASAGTGGTAAFCNAAVCRDTKGDIGQAFDHATSGVLKLLGRCENSLRNEIEVGSTPDGAVLRRLIWAFLRDTQDGLPGASLRGLSEWHPRLKAGVERLLSRIESSTTLARSDTWTRNLTKKDLPDDPLCRADLLRSEARGVRATTVHQAKGESIRAVLYLTQPKDLRSLLDGPIHEEGRIGYVAITRAEDLLVLGIPRSTASATVKALEDRGFASWAR